MPGASFWTIEILKSEPRSFSRPAVIKRSCSFFDASSVEVSCEIVSGRADGET
jgi:hypothetical protein